jgi:hypothetical protein
VKAIAYFERHFDRLTLFCKIEGAKTLPLELFSNLITRRNADGLWRHNNHSPLTIPAAVAAAIDAVLGVCELPMTCFSQLIVASATE